MNWSKADWSKSKTVYGKKGEEEWVNVRNFMNKSFRAQGPCSICKAMKCNMVWYSIKSKEVRCMKCFAPILPWSERGLRYDKDLGRV